MPRGAQRCRRNRDDAEPFALQVMGQVADGLVVLGNENFECRHAGYSARPAQLADNLDTRVSLPRTGNTSSLTPARSSKGRTNSKARA